MSASTPYRRLVWAGLTFLFVVDVLEALPPLILKATLDLALAPNGLQFRDQLLQLAAAYLGVTVVQAIGRYGWRMYLIRASFLAGRDIRQTYANLFRFLRAFLIEAKSAISCRWRPTTSTRSGWPWVRASSSGGRRHSLCFHDHRHVLAFATARTSFLATVTFRTVDRHEK